MAAHLLEKLIPLAALVTPNTEELSAITGEKIATDLAAQKIAGHRL